MKINALLSASFDNDEDSREFVKCKIESLLATQDRKQPEGNTYVCRSETGHLQGFDMGLHPMDNNIYIDIIVNEPM